MARGILCSSSLGVGAVQEISSFPVHDCFWLWLDTSQSRWRHLLLASACHACLYSGPSLVSLECFSLMGVVSASALSFSSVRFSSSSLLLHMCLLCLALDKASVSCSGNAQLRERLVRRTQPQVKIMSLWGNFQPGFVEWISVFHDWPPPFCFVYCYPHILKQEWW